MNVEIKGLEDFARRLGVATERLVKAAEVAAQIAGAELAGLAQEAVPVDTGALRDSCYVTEPAVSSGRLVVEIGYGMAYAPIVHEKSRSPWFLNAINAYSMQVRERFAATVRQGLHGEMPSAPSRFPVRPLIGFTSERPFKRMRKSWRTKQAQRARTTMLRRMRRLGAH